MKTLPALGRYGLSSRSKKTYLPENQKFPVRSKLSRDSLAHVSRQRQTFVATASEIIKTCPPHWCMRGSVVTHWNPAALERRTPRSHTGLGSDSVELKKQNKTGRSITQRKSILIKFRKIQLDNLLLGDNEGGQATRKSRRMNNSKLGAESLGGQR